MVLGHLKSVKITITLIKKKTMFILQVASAAAGAALAKAAPYIVAAVGSGIAALSSRANRKSNEKLAEKQFQQNKEMWNLQNQYNSPSAQVGRLKAAGLNPALAYGGSGAVTGNADATPNLDFSGAMNSPLLPDFSSSIQQGMTTAQLRSQIELNGSAADKNRIDAIKTSSLMDSEKRLMESNIILNSAKASESYQNAAHIQASISQMVASTEGQKLDNRLKEMSIYVSERTLSDQIASAGLKNALTEAEVKNIEASISKMPYEVSQLIANTKHLYQSIELMAEQGKMTKSQTANLNMEWNKLQKEFEQLGVQTKIKEKDLKWYVFDKVAGTVLDAAKVGVSAYTGVGLMKAAKAKAGIY